LLARVGLKQGEPKFQDVSIPSVPSVAPVSSVSSVAPAGAAASASGAGAAAPQTAPAAPKPGVLPGTVLSQSPPAGYRVDVGAVVLFTVAK
jgi:hypothetical protein